jgi:hypothetical protein
VDRPPERIAALPPPGLPRLPEPGSAPPALAPPALAPAARVVLRAREEVRVRVGAIGARTVMGRALRAGEAWPLAPREVLQVTPAGLALLEVLVDMQPLPRSALPAPEPGAGGEALVTLEAEDLLQRAALALAAPPDARPGTAPPAADPAAPQAPTTAGVPVAPPPRRQPVVPATAPPPRPAPNPRCRAIMERAQIGEPLSDADRAVLRTDCRG